MNSELAKPPQPKRFCWHNSFEKTFDRVIGYDRQMFFEAPQCAAVSYLHGQQNTSQRIFKIFDMKSQQATATFQLTFNKLVPGN